MKGVTSVTVSVPLTIRRRGGRKQIIGPDGAVARQGECGAGVVPVNGDPALIKALARGFRWRRMLEDGRYGSISEMAKAEGVERGYVGTLLRLTLLPPPMVEAILDGRQPEGVTLPGLMEPFPVEWERQPTARRKLTTLDSRPPTNIAWEELWYAGIAPCPAL
jgi:hypothetical protein